MAPKVITIMRLGILRTVGHTLTTKELAIMTIETKLSVALDVCVENEVFNLCRRDLPDNSVFSAISWCLNLKPREEMREEILKLILQLFSKQFLDHNIWLLVGNSALQPNTRIVKYRRLWGGLKACGIDYTDYSRAYEKMFDEEGKLKFFGVIPFSNKDIHAATQTMSYERSTYLVVLPISVNVEEIVSKGWNTNVRFDKGLLEFVAMNSGVLIRAVGEFDDPETCLIALAEPQIISSLIGP